MTDKKVSIDKNVFILEISSNMNCKVFEKNKLLFILKEGAITKLKLKKSIKEFRFCDTDNNEIYETPTEFVHSYYKTFIDLISIIKAKHYIDILNPSFEDVSHCSWLNNESQRISMQVISDIGLIENFGFKNNHAVIAIRSFTGAQYCIIDKLGNITNYSDTFIENFSEGVRLVQRNKKYGFVDTKNRLVIKCKYNNAHSFSEGLACVQYKNKFGFIDINGNIVINFIYDDASDFYHGVALVQLNGKYGYINKQGYVIFKFIFDKASSNNEDYSTALIQDKYFLLNFQTKKKRLIKYDCIQCWQDEIGIIKNSSKGVIINKKGEEVFNCNYDTISNFSNSLACVEKNNKYGFIDKSGRQIIPLIYDSVEDFSDGLACVMKNNKYGFIDSYGKIVIEIKYRYAKSFTEGLAIVQIGKKFGYINKKSELTIKAKYDSAKSFNEGLACVELNNKYGFINCVGDTIIDIDYDYVGKVSEGLVFVVKDDIVSLMNIHGKRLFTNMSFIDFHSHVPHFQDGRAMYKENFKFGKHNLITGEFYEFDDDDLFEMEHYTSNVENFCKYSYLYFEKESVQFEYYYEAYDFSQGLALVMDVPNHCYFIDKQGKAAFSKHFRYANSFSNDYACCSYNNMHFGFIDKSGEVRIPFIYRQESHFSEDLALVVTNDRYGCIDIQGNVVLPAIAEEYFEFKNGYAIVKISGHFGVITKLGEFVIQTEYEQISQINNDNFIVKKNQLYGIVNQYGEFIIPIKYESIIASSDSFVLIKKERSINDIYELYNLKTNKHSSNQYNKILEFHDNVALVELNGHWGLIDKNGTELIRPKFHIISNFKDGFAYTEDNFSRFGFVDISGNEIVLPKYYDVKLFSEGLAAVKNYESLWGYIDELGNEVIHCQFNDANSFSEGLACVKTKYGYCYIDKNGMDINGNDLDQYGLSAYYKAYDFINGYALIEQLGTIEDYKEEELEQYFESMFNEYDNTTIENRHTIKKYINKNGDFLDIRPTVEFISDTTNVKNDNFIIIEDASDFHNGYAKIKIKGKWRLLDSHGSFY